jgi:hypothetical protein
MLILHEKIIYPEMSGRKLSILMALFHSLGHGMIPLTG